MSQDFSPGIFVLLILNWKRRWWLGWYTEDQSGFLEDLSCNIYFTYITLLTPQPTNACMIIPILKIRQLRLGEIEYRKAHSQWRRVGVDQTCQSPPCPGRRLVIRSTNVFLSLLLPFKFDYFFFFFLTYRCYVAIFGHFSLWFLSLLLCLKRLSTPLHTP